MIIKIKLKTNKNNNHIINYWNKIHNMEKAKI